MKLQGFVTWCMQGEALMRGVCRGLWGDLCRAGVCHVDWIVGSARILVSDPCALLTAGSVQDCASASWWSRGAAARTAGGPGFMTILLGSLRMRETGSQGWHLIHAYGQPVEGLLNVCAVCPSRSSCTAHEQPAGKLLRVQGHERTLHCIVLGCTEVRTLNVCPNGVARCNA